MLTYEEDDIHHNNNVALQTAYPVNHFVNQFTLDLMEQEPPEEGPKLSALCRSVTKDGWDLEIVIYEDGEGQWLLEVVNDADVSTCWTEPFETDQAALNEALKTIEENSLEYFHERQPWREQ